MRSQSHPPYFKSFSLGLLTTLLLQPTCCLIFHSPNTVCLFFLMESSTSFEHFWLSLCRYLNYLLDKLKNYVGTLLLRWPLVSTKSSSKMALFEINWLFFFSFQHHMEHRFPSSPAPKQTTGKSTNTLEQPLHLSEKGTLLRLLHFHGFSEYLAAGYHQRENVQPRATLTKNPQLYPTTAWLFNKTEPQQGRDILREASCAGRKPP